MSKPVPTKFKFVMDKIEHRTPYAIVTFQVTKQEAAQLQIASTQAFLDGPDEGVPSIEFKFVPAKKNSSKVAGDVKFKGIGGLEEEED